MSTLDFRSRQIRTNKLIASGSTGTSASLLVYPVGAASNLSGGINQAVFSQTGIGSDVFLYVSGAIGGKGSSTNGVSVFGGDLVVSGTLYANISSSQASNITSLVSGAYQFFNISTSSISLTDSQIKSEYILRFSTSNTTTSFCSIEYSGLSTGKISDVSIVLIGRNSNVSQYGRFNLNLCCIYNKISNEVTIDPAVTVVLPDIKTSSSMDLNVESTGSMVKLLVNGPAAACDWQANIIFNIL